MRQLQSPGRRKRFAGLSSWEAFAFIFLVGGYFFIGMNLYEPLWERWKIYDILEKLETDTATLKGSPDEIGSRLLKRMSVNGIYGTTPEHFKIQQTDVAMRLTFNREYPVIMPFGIGVVVKAQKVIELKRPKSY